MPRLHGRNTDRITEQLLDGKLTPEEAAADASRESKAEPVAHENPPGIEGHSLGGRHRK
jgi:hypothetical protein